MTLGLPSAIQRAQLQIAGLGDAKVVAAIERAIALATFQARERDGPCHNVSFGSVPVWPTGPMFGAFAGRELTPLMEALERLQRELVWAADCAEFTDAVNNSAQYLRAAGHLDLIAGDVVRLADQGE